MVFFKTKPKQVSRYQPAEPKRDGEKKDAFIERVRRESLTRQRVKVDNFNVTFGIEGPIVFKEKEKFRLVSATVENGKLGKYYILYYPDLKDLISRGKTFLRLDSGCFSGMIFGDKTCDCLQQLRKAQEIILENGGIIIHIPNHDGRGWGEFKMANQRIMDECSLDTISTAVAFYKSRNNFDKRDFGEASLILRALGFPKEYRFNLGTKNGRKASALIKEGFMVFSEPVELPTMNNRQKANLKAKYDYWQTNQRRTT